MALTYPFPGPPAPGESLEILPGIYWVRLPLPLKLDHVNVWVLEDGDGLTVVDTGVGDERTGALLRQVRATLPPRPLIRILVTHHHPDHSGLADRLSEEHGAEVLMSTLAHEAGLVLRRLQKGTDAKSTAARLAGHGLSAEAQRFLIENEASFQILKPGLPLDFTPLVEGDTISTGRYSWRVIFGQGHAPDHVCLYCGRHPPERGRARQCLDLRRHDPAPHLHSRRVPGHLAAGQSRGHVPPVGSAPGRTAGRHARPALSWGCRSWDCGSAWRSWRRITRNAAGP